MLDSVPPCEKVISGVHVLASKPGKHKPIMVRLASQELKAILFKNKKEYAPRHPGKKIVSGRDETGSDGTGWDGTRSGRTGGAEAWKFPLPNVRGPYQNHVSQNAGYIPAQRHSSLLVYQWPAAIQNQR